MLKHDRRLRAAVMGLICTAAAQRAAAHDAPFRALVVGDRPVPQTASQRTVEAAAISVAPKRSGDDLLRMVPGLLATRHGTECKAFQIFLRGFDAVHGQDVEARVDGVPLNELSNVHGQGYLDLCFLIPEVVQRLDADKGPFQLDQGPFAMAGSVRFHLGVPADARGYRVSYEVGTQNRHRALAVLAPRSLDPRSFVAIEALHDAGYGQNRQSGRASLLGKLRVVNAPRLQLDLLLSAFAARFGEPGVVPLQDAQEGRIGFYDSYSPHTDGASARIMASAALHAHLGQSAIEAQGYATWRRLRLDENFTGALLYPEQGDARRQLHHATGGGLRLRLQRPLPYQLTLLAGADLNGERIAQREDQITNAAEDPQPWLRNRDLTGTQLLGALQLGLRYHPRPWLSLQGGGRLDLTHFDVQDQLAPERSGAQTRALVSPRLTAMFSLPRGVSLFAAYGRGVRPPEARAVTNPERPRAGVDLSEYRGGSVQLSAADAGELGLRWRHGGLLEIGAAGFATYMNNEVVFDHVSARNVELNSTLRLGAEASLRLTPLRSLELLADATYVDARFLETHNPVPGAPRFLASLSGTFQHPSGVRAGGRLLYLAPRPLAYGATAGGFLTLDLLVAYRSGPVQLDLQIENVTNASWREGEFHFASRFDTTKPPSYLPVLHYAAGPPLNARAGVSLIF